MRMSRARLYEVYVAAAKVVVFLTLTGQRATFHPLGRDLSAGYCYPLFVQRGQAKNLSFSVILALLKK